jgi:hypothetical protein
MQTVGLGLSCALASFPDDEPGILAAARNDLNPRDAETALCELLRSGDPWLTACAAATAAERRLERLAPEIAALGQCSGRDVSRVSRSVAAVLEVG